MIASLTLEKDNKLTAVTYETTKKLADMKSYYDSLLDTNNKECIAKVDEIT